jgi:Cu/Ag efflux protein CusF
MTAWRRFGWLALAILLFLAGCGQTPKETAAKEYDIKGKVADVAADKKAVTLDHEDIPGLMKSMTMKFAVADPKVLEGIQAGDQVQGRLRAEDGKYTITRLEKR